MLKPILFTAGGEPAAFGDRPESPTVEVVRSFSYKMNLGNYESADFFCCHKTQCAEEDREEVSHDLDEFCMEEVRKSIAAFQARRKGKAA